jgi:cell division septal protein FtsQ
MQKKHKNFKIGTIGIFIGLIIGLCILYVIFLIYILSTASFDDIAISGYNPYTDGSYISARNISARKPQL